MVLVPFYRGAVVFNAKYCSMCGNKLFSSPFIEERLYLMKVLILYHLKICVLVPFYRGAVVFHKYFERYLKDTSSRPLLSRSGCIFFDKDLNFIKMVFSSPFIEERLYLR